MHRKSAKLALWAMIVLAILALCIGLWPSLKIYLAPKTLLTSALADTYDQLEQRMANSPILLAGSVLDFQNGNTMDVTLDTENKLLGPVQYDMHTGIQWNPRRILAQGTAKTQNREIDLSLYLDGDFAAVSSAGLLQNRYYGLTYDSFAKDIRSNSLLAMVIGDTTLRNWEMGIQDLKTCMNQNWSMPQLTEKDFRNLLVAILALQADVEQEDGFHVISFETTGAQIAAGLDYLQTGLPLTLGDNEEVEFSFWLRKDRLVLAEVDGDDWEIGVNFGDDPATDQVTVRYENGQQKQTFSIETQSNASVYQETISLTGATSASVSYQWEFHTGDLRLEATKNGKSYHLDMNLTPTEEGFRLTCTDIECLMHLLLGTKDSADSAGTLMVSKGSDFQTPAYKNFNQWTLDDLAALLGGVGSLFGLQIP